MIKDKFTQDFIIGFFGFAMLMLIVAALIAFCKTAFADTNEWLSRCRPYEPTVKQILISHELSPDYYYLMVAESRCTEMAKSQKGALGFWQLMPYTAKHYGCFHPDSLECSTHAASKYIKHLENMFGEFDTVIAAYNMGGHNLKKYGTSKDAQNLVFTVKRLINDSKKSKEIQSTTGKIIENDLE